MTIPQISPLINDNFVKRPSATQVIAGENQLRKGCCIGGVVAGAFLCFASYRGLQIMGLSESTAVTTATVFGLAVPCVGCVGSYSITVLRQLNGNSYYNGLRKREAEWSKKERIYFSTNQAKFLTTWQPRINKINTSALPAGEDRAYLKQVRSDLPKMARRLDAWTTSLNRNPTLQPKQREAVKTILLKMDEHMESLIRVVNWRDRAYCGLAMRDKQRFLGLDTLLRTGDVGTFHDVGLQPDPSQFDFDFDINQLEAGQREFLYPRRARRN